jgi:Glycosyl hydrolase family 76
MGMFVATLVTMVLAAANAPQPRPAPARAPRGPTLSGIASRALSTLLGVYYNGGGKWRACNGSGCPSANIDWGDDSLTFALALRESETHAAHILPVLSSLTATAPTYPAPCQQVSGCTTLSDRPSWDAVAAADEYLATNDPTALSKSEAAFEFVAGSHAYALGACPTVPYQKAGGGDTDVKTLETEGNLIKAALLLYRATHDSSYLAFATSAYEAARTYFLDPSIPLYTTYVFDNGSNCAQLPHRFFASVNGNMIWAGVELYQDTGQTSYLDDATATAREVSSGLSDARGIFADLQAENDVVEPLVEGMDALAVRGQGFARTWLLHNAAAAASSRTSDGSFGRFFDGPPPTTTVTIWQTNGGIALEFAAASLDPGKVVQTDHPWQHAKQFNRDISSLPASIGFHGSGITVFGTLGEQCCVRGHAEVLVDGQQTLDWSGIWQNKSSANMTIPETIMFSWRWPSAGHHRVSFLPGIYNPKEGGSFLHLDTYEVIPG